ncbi:MAG: hypothetical protein AMJ79_13595 [Phycisphaerae bacterium SM23_30]|nr:MAG: hypothetical protein AMJ79_13595 [Phycisphaerae bacterium SM23_30]
MDISELNWGDYYCELIISDPCALNSPQMVNISLHVIGPIIELSETEFEFTAPIYDPNTFDEVLIIRNIGGGTLNWQISHDSNWLKAEPSSGSLTRSDPEEMITLNVDKSGLNIGFYNCRLTISDPCALNSPQYVAIQLHVCIPGNKYVPSEFLTIQAAINAAGDGDIITVADGIYTGPGNRKIDFKNKAVTVRSAVGPQNCIIDLQGHHGFYFQSGEEPNSVLDGFTITNGFSSYGSGICIKDSSPTIRNCIITGNQAGICGGLYGSNSSPKIISCTFSNNTADYGSGASFYFGRPELLNCTFNENQATDSGGGLYLCDSDAVILLCTFNNNTANYGGGTLFSISAPTIFDCHFISNQANTSGGGLYSFSSDPIISHCTISDNSANYGGGSLSYNSSFWIFNSLFHSNQATKNGGALYNEENNLYMFNCTFSKNIAANGLALACDSLGGNPSRHEISNCIIWDGGNEIWNNDGSMFSITYSDVQGGWLDLGNIDIDPCFVDVANNDYHLQSHGWRWDANMERWTWDYVTSRCIDAGNPGSLLGGEFLTLPEDPANKWGKNLRVNMGVYGGTAQASIAPIGWSLRADLNNDGTVNLLDYAHQLQDWYKKESALPGDLNRDGSVAFLDLYLLILDWLTHTTWCK